MPTPYTFGIQLVTIGKHGVATQVTSVSCKTPLECQAIEGEPREGTFHTCVAFLQLPLPTRLHLLLTSTSKEDKTYGLHFTNENSGLRAVK